MAEVQLPDGWAFCSISDITAINPKLDAEEHLVAGFVPMALAPTNFLDALSYEERIWGEIRRKYTNFSDGDVIFAKVTPCFENGKAAFVEGLPNGIGAGSSEFYVLRPCTEGIHPKFILGVIKSYKFMQEGAHNMTGAVGLRRVPRAFVESFPVALPPVAEQKVIADKLDSLLAQVDTTKARLERILQTLKYFRQSILSAAVSGKLTEEWRRKNQSSEPAVELKERWLRERKERFEKEQLVLVKSGKQRRKRKFRLPSAPDLDTATVKEIPCSWVLVSVSEFADCLDSQRIPVRRQDRNNTLGLYPYFGANGEVDRVDDFIFNDDLVLVTEDETFYGRERPIAYRFSGKCWVNNHAHVLRAPTKEANDFLCFALMFYNVLPWLSGTTGRAKLTQAALNSLPLGLPPLDEIKEIVRRVEQLFSHADTIEQQVTNALARVDSLTQSILAKAFRGELTAQWRRDNPELISGDNSAEALLARIQAERAQQPARRRRTPAKA